MQKPQRKHLLLLLLFVYLTVLLLLQLRLLILQLYHLSRALHNCRKTNNNQRLLQQFAVCCVCLCVFNLPSYKRRSQIERKKNPQHIRVRIVLCVVCRLCLDYENISQLQSQHTIACNTAWRKGLSHQQHQPTLHSL